MIPVERLPDDVLETMKEQFITQLSATEREGVEPFLEYLESTDFYTAPASTSGHGSIEGGLLRHSLYVCRYLQNFLKPFADEVSDDSIVIVALLHDICKVNFYEKRTRNVKIDGRWEEQESFFIEDQLPLGHGEKSMFLVQRYIPLSDDEAMAIRWHMGGYDDASRQFASGRSQSNAYERCKLAVALNIADMYVANLLHA